MKVQAMGNEVFSKLYRFINDIKTQIKMYFKKMLDNLYNSLLRSITNSSI